MQKQAVVTGGAGFVGSHLCERLVTLGYQVISLDNYFTGSKENHIEGVEYRDGHTKDIAKLIPEHPDLIYHLGEYSRVALHAIAARLRRSGNAHPSRGQQSVGACRLLQSSAPKTRPPTETRSRIPLPALVATQCDFAGR